MLVFIVSDFGDVTGGAAKVAIDSARALAEAGVKVVFIYAIPPAAAALEHPNVTCHLLKFPEVWQQRNPLKAALQGIWNKAARSGVEAVIATCPEAERILHVHQWSKAFSPSVLAAGREAGIPTVVSLHDYFISCPNGAYYHFPTAQTCSLTPMSLGCVTTNCDRSGRLHKTVRVVRQAASNHAVAEAGDLLTMLSVSPSAEKIIADFLPLDARRAVIRSPIHVRQDVPAAIGEDSPFIFVGRLTEEKGVRLLVEAARATGAALTLVGTGPLFDEMNALGGKIRCLGWLSAAEVAVEIRRARALVFPSSWFETGGLVVLEALAQGIPAIVSRITAAADFIVDGENGYLIEPHDLPGLIAKFRTLQDTDLAVRLGQQAHRRYWSAPYTPARHAEELVSLYRSILRTRIKAA